MIDSPLSRLDSEACFPEREMLQTLYFHLTINLELHLFLHAALYFIRLGP